MQAGYNLSSCFIENDNSDTTAADGVIWDDKTTAAVHVIDMEDEIDDPNAPGKHINEMELNRHVKL